MSIRDNLADNLRRLCASKSSINAACRDMGINRQQFERYLTRQATPGPRTLKRICAYFKIEEHELFADPSGEPAGNDRRDGRIGKASPQTCLRVLEPLVNGPPASLKPGIYYLWLTIPRLRSRVICTLIIIRKDDDALTFRRVTGAGESRSSKWSRYRGDHRGIVVERIGQYLLVAVNQRGTLEPSFLRLKWVPLSDPLLSGEAMIFTPAGPSITTAVMRPAEPGTTLLQALRKARVYQVTDPEMDELVLNQIDEQCRDTIRQLQMDYELPA